MSATPRSQPGPLPAHPTLSVVVPVFNERATVQAALDALMAKRIAGWDIEVVIVESNSPDGSREIVQQYQGRPGVKIVLEDRPRGKGHAVRAGFAQMTGDVVLIQDADLEYDVADYELLLAPIIAGTHLFVLGSRHSPGQWSIRKFKGQFLSAALLNGAHWFFTAMIDVSLGLTLRDPFTMYDRVASEPCSFKRRPSASLVGSSTTKTQHDGNSHRTSPRPPTARILTASE